MQTSKQKLDVVKDNAFTCFNAFKDAELQKPSEDIFNNSFKINFYTSLRNFFEDAEYFEDDVIEALLDSGISVIDDLYWQFLKIEYYAIGTYSEIYDFINDATNSMKGDEYTT